MFNNSVPDSASGPLCHSVARGVGDGTGPLWCPLARHSHGTLLLHGPPDRAWSTPALETKAVTPVGSAGPGGAGRLLPAVPPTHDAAHGPGPARAVTLAYGRLNGPTAMALGDGAAWFRRHLSPRTSRSPARSPAQPSTGGGGEVGGPSQAPPPARSRGCRARPEWGAPREPSVAAGLLRGCSAE